MLAPTMPPPRYSPQRDHRLRSDGAQIAFIADALGKPVSYTHLTLPTTCNLCRSRWSPYH